MASTMATETDDLSTAFIFALNQGGMAAARAKVAKLKEDEVLAFVIDVVNNARHEGADCVERVAG
jgi:hypothetical protein